MIDVRKFNKTNRLFVLLILIVFSGCSLKNSGSNLPIKELLLNDVIANLESNDFQLVTLKDKEYSLLYTKDIKGVKCNIALYSADSIHINKIEATAFSDVSSFDIEAPKELFEFVVKLALGMSTKGIFEKWLNENIQKHNESITINEVKFTLLGPAGSIKILEVKSAVN